MLGILAKNLDPNKTLFDIQFPLKKIGDYEYAANMLIGLLEAREIILWFLDFDFL